MTSPVICRDQSDAETLSRGGVVRDRARLRGIPSATRATNAGSSKTRRSNRVSTHPGATALTRILEQAHSTTFVNEIWRLTPHNWNIRLALSGGRRNDHGRRRRFPCVMHSSHADRRLPFRFASMTRSHSLRTFSLPRRLPRCAFATTMSSPNSRAASFKRSASRVWRHWPACDRPDTGQDIHRQPEGFLVLVITTTFAQPRQIATPLPGRYRVGSGYDHSFAGKPHGR